MPLTPVRLIGGHDIRSVTGNEVEITASGMKKLREAGYTKLLRITFSVETLNGVLLAATVTPEIQVD